MGTTEQPPGYPPPLPDGGRGLADKINALFEVKRRPDGRPFSNEELAVASGGRVSRAYLSLLRRGERTNPTMSAIQALADFFRVEPGYFFEAGMSVAAATQLALLRSLVDARVTRVAMRLGGLSPTSLEVLDKVIEELRATEGLDSPQADRGRAE